MLMMMMIMMVAVARSKEGKKIEFQLNYGWIAYIRLREIALRKPIDDGKVEIGRWTILINTHTHIRTQNHERTEFINIRMRNILEKANVKKIIRWIN
jgi:hypothetical protein